MPLKDPEARKAYHREYMKKYYNEHPEAKTSQRQRVRINARQAGAKKREWLVKYLRAHPCVDCGETDLDVLDFDHVRGVKEANVGNLVAGGTSFLRLQAEVAKCEVRCANCHRKITRRRARDRGIEKERLSQS